MATITQASNPTLWAVLKGIYDHDEEQQYIQRGKALYRVVQLTDGSMAFSEYDNLELIDSRSLIKSRPAKYSKLDG